MKTSCIVAFTLFLVGCETSTRPSALLTAEQAQRISVQLANDKASTLYHCQPFGSGQPAHFAQGRWVWADRQGYGNGDIEAAVELAANGSTNDVDLKLLDSRQLLGRGF
jgi:hypothetical protein